MSLALDICVCSFRRASLTDTLMSLMAQKLPRGIRAGVVVVDNDDGPSARDRVEALAEGALLPIRYLHRPGRNISMARNAALEASAAPILAFIDDDEIADPDWISELLAVRAATQADIVLGPVQAIYPDDAPAWMSRADIHATRPVWVGGEIRTGYSCNVLIDRTDPTVAAARFEPALGRSGGEDSFFFRGLTARGARIAFAPKAWVREPVTPERLRLSWLVRRRVRMGQTHALSLLAHDHAPRLSALALAGGKAAICAALAAICLPNRARALREGLRACLHFGVVLGLAGRAPRALYGVAGAGELG